MVSLFSQENFLSYVEQNIDSSEVQTSISNIIAHKYFHVNYGSNKLDFSKEFNSKYFKDKVDKELLLSILKSKQFLNWFLNFSNDEINFLLSSLEVDNNKIKLFRAIAMDEDYLDIIYDNEMIDLGIYWTFDKQSAYPYYGSKLSSEMFIFEGIFDINNIDLNMSILLNFSGDTSSEKELRVIKGSLVHNFTMYKKYTRHSTSEFLCYLPNLKKVVA
jgi:hypothetical protein